MLWPSPANQFGPARLTCRLQIRGLITGRIASVRSQPRSVFEPPKTRTWQRSPEGQAGAAVTENVVDFAAERDVALVFVLEKNLPAGGGQAAALAKVLDRWAQEYPDPYLGPHWPST